MEILPMTWDIGKRLWVPIKRHINYIKSFQENFEKLKQKAQDLYNRKADVDREIESVRDLQIPTNECQAWLNKVDEIVNKVNGIEAEFEENRRCLGEWCPNIWWRMKLSERFVNMIDDIANLKEESMFESGVVTVAPPRAVERMPITTIKGETSGACTVQKILGCLRDDEIGKIGVWGMGGVGKTTVVKNLHNLPEIIQLFEIVIWVTVSKDCRVRKCQKDIADRLSLRLEDNETDERIARKLFQKLGNMKFLLLLDDVWDMVDLEAVGVPNPTREDGCKIVLTSRFLNVCRKMETDVDIRVEVLSETEAWDLFCTKVGDVVNSPNIEPLARGVVEECGGLPLVLTVIGRSLRKVNGVHVWSNALTELKRAKFQINVDMENSVFMQLKFSYDRLKDDNVKNCFLYCALYPEDHEIVLSELIEQWWAEGLIDGKLNLGEAYDKGHAILNDLTDASLLESIEDYRQRLVRVKMHDVIRDLALRITSPEGEGFGRYVVKAGVGMKTPSNEEWEQAEKMSLMHNDLTFLPNSPKCAFLTTLLLQRTENLEKFPTSFFEHMHSLQVLNLTFTGIQELPSSLFNLASLRGLFLDSCKNLCSIPSGIRRLTRLEVLHLGSCIGHLPIEVGQLTRLRSLRVRFDGGIDTVSSGRLLSGLTLLEDLWVYIDLVPRENLFSAYAQGVAEELVKLRHLISLNIQFPKVEYLEYFIHRSCNWSQQRFKSFTFLVGVCRFSTFYDHNDRRLELRNLKNNERCKKLSDICSMEMLKGLEVCVVKNCKAIETLIDGNGLPNLERLVMEKLPELRNIWEGPVLPQSVTFLRVLKIFTCPKLRNIFSLGMIHHLSNLQELSIIDCEIVEMVKEEDMAAMVVDDEEDVAVTLFPKLKCLTLNVLPMLARICKPVPNPIAWPSLERIFVNECPNLKNFPLSSSQAPALTKVFKQAVELEYEDDATTQYVSRLHRLC